MSQSNNIMRCKRIVVKYGGVSLADDERMLRAVTAVADEAMKGTQVAVVVSAIGKTTDFLLQVAKNVSNGKVKKEELDDILATGERASVRIFAAALRAKGVKSRYFDPLDPDWPIITDDAFSNANPVLKQCEERIQQHVLPLIEKGVVPIIAGFVGRTSDNKITTIGRGGSDTTAFILAKALKADEVILVTDSEGIMSADPKLVNNPKRLDEIDVDALVGLADSGTKFIHRKALKYKDPSINVKIISYAHGNLGANGTLINGAMPAELDISIASPSPVMSITVVGCDIFKEPAIIQELVKKSRAHTQLIGLSADYNSIILYALEGEASKAFLEAIHETVLHHKQAIAMAVRKQLALIKVKGVGLEETPGIIGRISEVLRLSGINIFGVLTITSSILFFVDWSEKEVVLGMVKRSLQGG